MGRWRLATSLAFVLLLSGCGGNLTPKEPPAASGGGYLAARMPTDNEKLSTIGVENSYFGVSVLAGGGNLAAGLLLGPFGTAMNIAALRSEANDRAAAIKGVTAIDVAALLREAAPDLASQQGRGVELVPSVVAIFPGKENYRLSCAILASAGSWRLRYVADQDTFYPLATSSDAAVMRPEIKTCIARAYGLYRSHAAGEFAAWRNYEFETADGFLGSSTVRLPLHEPSLPGRVISNSGFALQEFRRSAIQKLAPQ